MTVFKDVRTLVNGCHHRGRRPAQGRDPGHHRHLQQRQDRRAGQASLPVVAVTRTTSKSALIDSGYYKASDFTGLDAVMPRRAARTGSLAVGIVLPTKDEPRWIAGRGALQGALESRRLLGRNSLQPG